MKTINILGYLEIIVLKIIHLKINHASKVL
jgi:hypothetical protein